METLRIQLLGNLSLHRGDQPLPRFATRKAEHLFLFLLLNRTRLFPREVLVGTFWGDRPEAVARKCLRTAIWRLRNVLEPSGVDPGTYIAVENRAIGFNRDTDYWLDVEEFEERASLVKTIPSQGLSATASSELNRAVELYRGDLLEGVYDDWCLFERERLKALYLSALETLMRHHEHRREWDLAIAQGRRLVAYDPLREHIHRDLMQLYARKGNRPAALAQYATCERLLADELNIEPMKETRELYEELRAESGDEGRSPGDGAIGVRPGVGRGAVSFTRESPLSQFWAAAGDIERAKRKLLSGIDELRRRELGKTEGRDEEGER